MDTPLWDNNEPNSNVFGFEPHIFPLELFIQYDSRNYPCCTVNHPQAFPKFWANSFMVDQSDQSLIHAFLGPASFSGVVGSIQVKGTARVLVCKNF